MSLDKKKRKLSTGKTLKETGIHILLLLLALLWLLPFVWLILNSFRDGGNRSYFPNFFPDQFSLVNYQVLFDSNRRQILDFPRAFMNTLFVSIMSCIISVSFVMGVSFVMSRRRYKTRKLMLNINMILGLFPGFMAMVAVYFILKAVGLTEGDWTYLALILVFSAGSGAGFLLMKGYMDTIPKSLDEAALIDGANQWQIFTKIIIPISKPMIVFQVLTAFLGPWVDFIFARVIAGANSKYYTVSVVLYNMLDRERITYWYLPFTAGAVLVAIPISILTIMMQRFYNQSFSGAVKG